MIIYPSLILFPQMLFCMPSFSCMASIFSCIIQYLKFSHMDFIHKSLDRAPWPNRRRVHTHTCPNQAVHHEQPSQALVWAVRYDRRRDDRHQGNRNFWRNQKRGFFRREERREEARDNNPASTPDSRKTEDNRRVIPTSQTGSKAESSNNHKVYGADMAARSS